MTLEEIRTQINKIDKQILEKLNRRMILSLQARKFKSRIKDPKRETQILNQIKKETKDYHFVRKKFAQKIFKKIIQESCKIQNMKRKEEP